MSTGSLRSLFQLAFQVSPIILAGGVASNIPGKLLPIVAITEGLSVAEGVLTGSVPENLDEFFAQYLPMPGGTLISQAIGEYPFANQAVAANAVIQQPLTISMMMIAPVRDVAGYAFKLPIFSFLQATLAAHNAGGGLYHVATPAFVYTNCVMTGMTDVSEGESRQRQVTWQLDFRQPLVTPSQAAITLGAYMQKISNGTQLTGNPAWSGPQASSGAPTAGVAPLSGTTNLTGAVQSFAAHGPGSPTATPLQ